MGATVTISSGLTTGDVLAVVTQNGISGTYNSGTGVLTLTGTATVAHYQTALRSATYVSSSDDPTGTADNRTITWLVTDANCGGIGPGAETSTGVTSTITITASNDTPVSTAGATLAYTENENAAAIDNTIALSDADDTQIVGATVTISSGLTTGDVLAVSTQNGISGTYNSGTGVLTMTGTATVAYYQTALRSTTYVSSSDDPTATADNRTITWLVTDANSDGAGAETSTGVTSVVSITAVNDLPTTGNLTLSAIEDIVYTFSSDNFTFSDVDSADSISAVKITTLETTGTLYVDADNDDTYDSGEDVAINDIIEIVNIANLQFIADSNTYGIAYTTFGFKVSDGTAYSSNSGTNTINVAARLDIGDNFGGGVVGYILQPGESIQDISDNDTSFTTLSYDTSMQKGLIVANVDQSNGMAWSNISNVAVYSTGTEMSTGASNSLAIITQSGHTVSASKSSTDYSVSGDENWYLPSMTELKNLYQNKVAIGVFSDSTYWTSSEADATQAWNLNFGNGNQDTSSKTDSLRVRAVRAFAVNVIFGGPDNDSLIGSNNNDYILGQGGNDTITTGGGNDLAYGGPGNDVFNITNKSGTFNDIIDGGAGTDTLSISYTGVSNLGDFVSFTYDSTTGYGTLTDANGGKINYKNIELITVGNYPYTPGWGSTYSRANYWNSTEKVVYMLGSLSLNDNAFNFPDHNGLVLSSVTGRYHSGQRWG